VPRSGVADLLHCLASWACRHPARLVEIWWAGEGCLRGVLEAQPIPANLSQRFLGPLSREEIASAFTQCSALALPALFSEWSHFVSEALVAGLPVLGSNRCRAVAEFLTHGETGWVFDPHSPGEIGQAVDLALTASPEDLRRMGIAAAKRLEPLSSSRLEERIGRVLGLNPPDGMFEAAGSGF
jgi:glycosyltransferase involved in cell wall biosynthesis